MAFLTGGKLEGNRIATSACDVAVGFYFLRGTEMTTAVHP